MKTRDIWLWLTWPTAILTAIAAACGLLDPNLYREPPMLRLQVIGQDAITLVVGLPALVISGLLARRGSLRARLVWLGVLVYLVYAYAGYAFAVRFNYLFLVYVALLGCALYALIGGLLRTDWSGIESAFGEHAPVKTVSLFLAIVAALFYLIWLSSSVPAVLSGQPAQDVVESGTPTNFIHVLDMAWILPALFITAYKLWRREAVGFALAGAALAFMALLALAILGMAVALVISSLPPVIPLAVIFVVMFGLSLGLLVAHLRNLNPAKA